jgi:hypothetical protein
MGGVWPAEKWKRACEWSVRDASHESRGRVLARVECAETSVFANLARTKRAC